MHINIIVDISGSMTENGKDSVVKYLLNAIEGYAVREKRIAYRLFRWGDEIESISDVSGLSFRKGPASDRIAEFIKEHSGERCLILSDGGFSRKTEQGMKRILERKDIYYIGVGCDCDLSMIRRLADSDKIFSSQDVIACLKNMIDGA